MIVIFVTCADEDEAQKIAEKLIQDHLAACVHIMPPHQSLYRWQGKIERAMECNILIKTQAHLFAPICDEILKLHSYEVPALFSLPVENCHEAYKVWLAEQTR